MAGIKYVKLEGKSYPVSLNVLSLVEYIEDKDITLDELDEHLQNLSNVLSLFLHMMKYGHKRANKRGAFTMTLDDLADLVGFGENIEVIAATIAKFMPKEAKQESGKKTSRAA